MLTRQEFEQEVSRAIDELPSDILRNIANVAITVDEWADEDTLELAELDDPRQLLGFYHGVPLTQRLTGYGMVPPDKITLYRQPILSLCRNDQQARERIRTTLRHEIAHYFGIDDDRLVELGRY